MICVGSLLSPPLSSSFRQRFKWGQRNDILSSHFLFGGVTLMSLCCICGFTGLYLDNSLLLILGINFYVFKTINSNNLISQHKKPISFSQFWKGENGVSHKMTDVTHECWNWTSRDIQNFWPQSWSRKWIILPWRQSVLYCLIEFWMF